ncbi:hypothetical protein [Sphingobium sp. CECT 9361]|uniref:hypothetical protein n=1 Tax=Sphingobium sp. CECT 9361 TaxID=2845384 RepID=UPI001E2F5F26|nr:hypothetical protein [Sphingobium sp. CECT 9361]CAH0357284.1 hypothetical protein SPH9361_04933 [Sphingobium sp. CECT 9361]
MITVSILDQTVDLAIELVDADDHRDAIVPRFEEMAGTINAAANRFSNEQATVFKLTRTLTIFRRKIFRGKTISRSFMDYREKNFHWTLDEFVAWDPAPRRPTAYFHDAWHIRQFIELGEPPNDEDVLIDREQDAMAQQLDVARILNCDDVLIEDLTRYSNDRERIRLRLLSGVGFNARVKAHFEIFT